MYIKGFRSLMWVKTSVSVSAYFTIVSVYGKSKKKIMTVYESVPFFLRQGVKSSFYDSCNSVFSRKNVPSGSEKKN